VKLNVSLLGGFQVDLDGREVHGFESDKARALLAYLVAEDDRPHPRHQLAGLLWPDFPDDKARRNLSQALYNLRQTLGDHPPAQSGKTASALFGTADQCLGLKAGILGRVDLAIFRSGAAGCPEHRPAPTLDCPACRQGAAAAAGAYQGPFLAGLSLDGASIFDEWLVVERERLQRAALTLLNDLAAWHRRQGRLDPAVAYARRAVELDPLWEPAQRQLMHALWLAGRRAEALAQYDACRRLLWDELGVGPDEQTHKLQRRILADSEIVSPRPAGRSNLPHPLTPFIGRERAVHEIMALLARPDCRLLSLVGPGGSGKSRLAVEVARRLADDFPDGIFLVSLSQMASASVIPLFLAQTLGLPGRQQADPDTQLVDYLRQKRLLLIMDGFERLVEGAGLVVDILRHAAQVKILVTSRVRLRAKGEHIFTVEGLALPDEAAGPAAAEAESVRLFLSAAERTLPGYRPEPAELPAVADVCRLVEGMPLGIILASAWLELYRPAEIAAQIAAGLDFLAVEWADLPPRQRSLRATLDYTWQLLTAEQQQALAALSVFRGGFTAPAAAQVADLDSQALRELVERSVVQRAAGQRFTLHDLLSQYAAERLAQEAGAEVEAHYRHAAYFAALIAGLVDDLKSAGQQAALAQMETELANLSAAWRWAAAQGETALLDQALEGVGLFCELLGRPADGARACRMLVDALRLRPAAGGLPLARALAWLARFESLMGQDDQARVLCQESLFLLANKPTAVEWLAAEAFARFVLGEMLFQTDRYAAIAAYEQSVALCRQIGDRPLLARALNRQGYTHHVVGSYPAAQALFEESLALAQAQGDPRQVGAALTNIGLNAVRTSRIADGERYLGQAADHLAGLGDRAGTARSRFQLGLMHAWAGRLAEGLESMTRSAQLFVELGLNQEAGFALGCVAAGYCMQCQFEQGLAAARASLAFSEKHRVLRFVAYSHYWLAVALTAAGESDIERVMDHLQTSVRICREIDHPDELAASLAFIGRVMAAAGDLGQAQGMLAEAVAITSRQGSPYAAGLTVSMVAYFLARTGRPERALEIYSLVRTVPLVASMSMLEELAGRPIRELAATVMTPEEIEASEVRGRALDLWPTVAELAEELALG
jgi:DNA-binding SARP family transcriptional activator/predicted ATPase